MDILKQEILKRKAAQDTRRNTKITKTAPSVQVVAKQIPLDNVSSPLPSLDELVKRLRALKQPIQIFGESFEDQCSRLFYLESLQDPLPSMSAPATKKEELLDQPSSRSTDDSSFFPNDTDPQYDVSLLTMALAYTEPAKVSKMIGIFFQKVFNQWKESLENRPAHEKSNPEGKRQYAIFKQTSEYLKPFYKKCRKNRLEQDILLYITDICMLLHQKEYQKANDAYLRMSIGNSPWPIGVTAVNIHERSADERIETKNVAHVLNDETTRKWIQSIKRLMTFYQSQNLNEDLSKNVG